MNGFTYNNDPAATAAASLLAAQLATFGPAIVRESQPGETSKLQKIVLDWNTKADLTAAVALLQLGQWKTEPDSANTDKVYEKRPTIYTAYNGLVEQLDARYVVEKRQPPGLLPLQR